MEYVNKFLTWYGVTADRLLTSDIGWLNIFLAYRTPKYLLIDYWVIGLLNRALQILIVCYTVITLVAEKDWAYIATPVGTVNAFGSAGGAYADIRNIADYSTVQYCSNATHSFVDDATFTYATPECRFVVPSSIVHKGKGFVTISTM